jgi:hypothetical protein
VWRNRFTGYGRTGLGDMVVQYMGGMLAEKPEQKTTFVMNCLQYRKYFSFCIEDNLTEKIKYLHKNIVFLQDSLPEMIQYDKR